MLIRRQVLENMPEGATIRRLLLLGQVFLYLPKTRRTGIIIYRLQGDHITERRTSTSSLFSFPLRPYARSSIRETAFLFPEFADSSLLSSLHLHIKVMFQHDR